MTYNDTIVAISSGNINQAISIIRLSGEDSIKILQKIYTGKIGTDKTITYGNIIDNSTGKIIDEVLVNFFIGNKNYTGEDTIEINAHGGIIVTNKILNLLIANGARLAERGEFTRRAYLNGKITLEKAEAINALIHAKTNKQAEIAISQFNPQINHLIESLEQEILNIISIVEINIDYSDYNDIEQINIDKLKKLVNGLEQKIKIIINKSENANDIYRGINVAIVGRPNVGKSSLLNLLIGKEKAIVTNIAGTTRDIVEGEFEIAGILFKLIDTAGIRDTKNKIESIGIEKSKEAIKEAQIVIHIHEPGKRENKEDKIIKELSKDKQYIDVLNKKDLIKTKLPLNKVCISTKEKSLWELKSKMVEKYQNINLDDKDILYNQRQLSLLKSTLLNLQEVKQGLDANFGPEVVILDLTKAWENLREILNKKHDNEALLDNIFSKFCLGK
ncbi:tRNA modification GTPase TrmE [Metamycoplasma cloacale]|uniref:tRNA modification GTPase MnmE n=1 Tax=Metamycoplasma cloacale TaxID=92401 RepID=A0A2Z4LMR9_9BACT|nr:tRNA uridine-5-carboxymethylaminomethyl(34) synthesis GTPase MnmE [Metamycoplasma cloacale]AWX42537.1 tRNA uridine-5-carboxymethylaminomethyl(34) synthesis GTPase MnmE [Metamycoplasma cloacale]VEU79117.1 tRNA modification GTPase TrmE [Metamycoplasma cloacale]VEU79798.1 tRNA modification GTPase TrmE [Metamycoplasma cloacale]